MKKKLIFLISLTVISIFSFSQNKKKIIRSISVSFNTTANDKAKDSYLDISFYYLEEDSTYDDFGDGVVARQFASKEKIGGYWAVNSLNTVKLNLLVQKFDIEQHNDMKMELYFHTKNNDVWEFDYTVDMVYSDENGKIKTYKKEYTHQRLSQFSYNIKSNFMESFLNQK